MLEDVGGLKLIRQLRAKAPLARAHRANARSVRSHAGARGWRRHRACFAALWKALCATITETLGLAHHLETGPSSAKLEGVR
jgi:hypothetical protein